MIWIHRSVKNDGDDEDTVEDMDKHTKNKNKMEFCKVQDYINLYTINLSYDDTIMITLM